MLTDYECDEIAPSYITFYNARFGGHAVAKCENCSFTSVYWECACDLEHECEV